MQRAVIFILAVFIIGLAIAEPAHSTESADTYRDASREAAQKARDLAKKKRNLEAESQDLAQSLAEAALTLQAREQDVFDLDESISALQSKHSILQNRLSNDRNHIALLTAQLVRLARQPAVLMLTESQSGLEAARRQMLMSDLITQIQSQATEARTMLAELKATTATLRSQRVKAAALRQEARQARDRLQANLDRKETLSAKIGKDVSAAQQEAARMAEKAKSLEALMANVAKKQPKPSKSAPASQRIPKRLPVAGRVARNFGALDEDGHPQQGIMIATREDALVTAPRGGTIRFAGPFRSYKLIIIIDHGDGWHSLLAGLSKIHAGVGARVLAGEPVGRVGLKSAGQDGPMLYYEVRHNGTPTHPSDLG